MKLAFALQILGWVIPIILAPVVYLLARLFLNGHRSLDNLPPWLKRAAVLAIGVAVTAALAAAGVAMPAECVAMPEEITDACAQALGGPNVVKGVVAALTAMFLHHLKKANPRI